MAAKYNIPDANAVLIGLPWSFQVKLPLDLTGYHCVFSIRKASNLTEVQTWNDTTSAVVIGSYSSQDHNTPVTITLPASDTHNLKQQSAVYWVEVTTNLSTMAAGVRYLEGKIIIRR